MKGMVDITVCNNCGATHEGVRPVCASCGNTNVEHLAQLAPGEVVYTCGHCRHVRRLGPAENPAVTRKQFGKIHHGAALQIPLTLWNTIFKCESCTYWNWVTLDDRIIGFEMTCPDCGKESVFDSLGRHLELSKGFLEKIVTGQLRQTHKPVVLKCGHSLYLPTLIIEGKTMAEGEPVDSNIGQAPKLQPPPDPPENPGTEKKKTQPIPIVPPSK